MLDEGTQDSRATSCSCLPLSELMDSARQVAEERSDSQDKPPKPILPSVFMRNLKNFGSKDFVSMVGLFNSPPHQPHSKKTCFLMFRQNFMCINMCPLPLALSLDTMVKSLAQSSSFPPIRFTNVDKIAPKPSLLQAKQSSVSPRGDRCSRPSCF